MKKVGISEHLFELYPQMPRYANDPEESEVVKCYDRIMARFQGYYGKQPTFFAKASACPVLLGDIHQYVGYEYVSFCSTQNVIIAICTNNINQIKINNYQTAVYGERVLSTNPSEWKFDQEEDRYLNLIIKSLNILTSENIIKELKGMDLLIYSDFIEEPFMGWREALISAFYAAIYTVSVQENTLDRVKLDKIFKKMQTIQPEIHPLPQLINNKYAHFSFQTMSVEQKSIDHEIELDNKYSIVIAHSMTPLPKKLIQGKRFNLRRCEVLIGIELMKSELGFSKEIRSLKQLQDMIGCSLEELLESIEEIIPKGKISPEEIEQRTQKSMIQILKEVPYANNVIDQNTEFYPYLRIKGLLQDVLLIKNLNSLNLIASIQQSYANQQQFLKIGSEQLDQLIKIGQSYSFAHKIIGNGWGGNVLFLCDKSQAPTLIREVTNNFYLSHTNKILLSDDIEQYIHEVGIPCTGLMILNPESEIWY